MTYLIRPHESDCEWRGVERVTDEMRRDFEVKPMTKLPSNPTGATEAIARGNALTDAQRGMLKRMYEGRFQGCQTPARWAYGNMRRERAYALIRQLYQKNMVSRAVLMPGEVSWELNSFGVTVASWLV